MMVEEKKVLNEFSADFEVVEVNDLPVKGFPSFDAKKYLGKKALIAKIEVRKGEYGYYLYAESELLERLPNGLGVRASKIYGLKSDENDAPYILLGSKLDLELQELKLKSWKELKGTVVSLQLTELNKKGKRFLTW